MRACSDEGVAFVVLKDEEMHPVAWAMAFTASIPPPRFCTEESLRWLMVLELSATASSHWAIQRAEASGGVVLTRTHA